MVRRLTEPEGVPVATMASGEIVASGRRRRLSGQDAARVGGVCDMIKRACNPVGVVPGSVDYGLTGRG
jgi:hypothetical protein